MNTHDVRFVWLKVQSDTEWNFIEIFRRTKIIFGRHSQIFPRSREKVNNRVPGTNLNLLEVGYSYTYILEYPFFAHLRRNAP